MIFDFCSEGTPSEDFGFRSLNSEQDVEECDATEVE
jgi:hypothetical protein